LLGYDWNIIEGFLLAFVRGATAISIMPVFGYNAVPMQTKVAIGFVLAIALAPTAGMHLPATIIGPLPFIGAAAAEAAVGLVIGATAALMMIGAEFAGTLVGLQMGFSSANIMDPQLEQEVSIIGRFEYLLALIVFLSLDMHHLMLAALGESYNIVPVGTGVLGVKLPLMYGRMTAELFVVAVKLAAPVLAILMMTELALGFVARAMPQMNVFADSFPVKIGVGFMAMAVTFPLFVYVLSKTFDKYGGFIIQVIRTMTP